MTQSDDTTLSPVKRALYTIEKLEAEIARLKTPEPIAIVGMACRLPGASSPEALWSLLENGHDAVTAVPTERWRGNPFAERLANDVDQGAVGFGAFCQDVDLFDAEFFGISPREAHAMDPQQRMLMETSWEAIERANINPQSLFGTPTGVFVGLGTFDYASAQIAHGDGAAVGRHFVSGTVLSVAAGRISYALGLSGPSMTIDTACSSSLVALHQACRSLQQGESRVALAGGAGLLLSPVPSFAFAQAQMLSPTGRCRTFDAAADGYVRGEGCGVVVLKRLSDAQADGDSVLAIVRATAVNQDGASGGLTVPSGPAQEALMRAAQTQAGIKPSDLCYLEAHGTGTPLGDPIELGAIARAYGANRADPLLVGSLKTNFGHLEAAAGIAGVIKAVLCLNHGQVPPHLHYKQPSSMFDWHGNRIVVPTEMMPLPGGRRLAGVNAFGFSGTNAHVILEALPPSSPQTSISAPKQQPQLLALSARSAHGLTALAAAHAQQLEGLDAGCLRDYCATTALCRAAYPHRLAVVGNSPRELADWLHQYAVSGPHINIASGVAKPDACPPASSLNLEDHARLTQWRDAFVSGSDLDAKAVFGEEPWHKMPVPVTPFRRQRYWFDLLNGQSGQASSRQKLLEAGQVSPFEPRTSHDVRTRTLSPLLEDHIVFETRVIAGAVMIAAALEATGAGNGNIIRDVNILKALVVPVGSDLSLQIGIGNMRDRPNDLKIVGRVPSIAPDWSEYLNAVIEPDVAASPSADLALFQQRCSDPLDPALLYDKARRHGIVLGPRFQWLSQVWSGPGMVLARCEVPGGIDSGEAGGLHPGLIDGGFQLLIPALGGEYNATLVPTRIARMKLSNWPAANEAIWCCLELTRHDASGATADVSFFAQSGAELLSIRGLELRPVDRATLVGTTAHLAGAREGLAIEWRKQRINRPDLRFARDLEPDFPEAVLAQYDAEQVVLNRAALAYAAQAYHALASADETLSGTPEEIARRLGIAPAHHRLNERLLAALADAEAYGIRRVGPQRFELSGTSLPDPDHLLVDIEGDQSAVRAERDLLARCGPALPEILSGKLDPLQILFPAGDAKAIAGTYAEALGTQMLNMVVRELLGRWVKSAGDGPVRVLEIGAGTGATTRAVLAALVAADPLFTFTDVSRSLLDQAAAAGEYGDIGFEVLDIERDPGQQRLPLAAQDIVVAANVLHATRNLKESLAHARALLADGGIFVLVEATVPRLWLDLTFGLTTGWWRFEDDRTVQNYPLLSAAEWRTLLGTAGFEDVCVVADPEALGQAVIVARAAPCHDETKSWLIMSGNDNTLGVELANLLTDHGDACFLTPSADAAGTLSTLAAAEETPTHIVSVANLDSLDAELVDPIEMADQAVQRSMEIIHLVRAAAALRNPPSLIIITKNAVATSPMDSLSGLVAAALPGLAKVIALEYPEIDLRFVDIDDFTSVADLGIVLRGKSRDIECALRHGDWVVPRLVPHTLPAAPAGISAQGSYLITGGYGGIGLALADWLAKQGAGHVVLIGRRPPDNDALTSIAAIESAGTRMECIIADVADERQMRKAFAERHDAPPIRGVFHAAGILHDVMIEAQTVEELAMTYAPKVRGAWVLHRLTADQPLEHFVLFSSAASMLGSVGQSGHASANAWLDGFAWYRRQSGRPATSINWGAWSQIGAAARLGRDNDFRAQGFELLVPTEALDIMGAVLADTKTQVGAIPLELGKFLSRRPPWALFDELGRDTGFGVLAAALESNFEAVDLGVVLHELALVLGCDDETTIDPDRDFIALGLDSLATLDLRNRLQARIGVPVPATVILQYPNARELTEYLSALSALPNATMQPHVLQATVVDDMTEAELDAMLADLLTESGD